MRTLRTIRPLAIVVGLLAACAGQAQVTNPTNNAAFGDYVGCDNTSPFPLEIRQNDNQPIDCYTANRFRMRINPTVTYPTLNNFINIPADGFALITPDNSFLTQPPKGPFSHQPALGCVFLKRFPALGCFPSAFCSPASGRQLSLPSSNIFSGLSGCALLHA